MLIILVLQVLQQLLQRITLVARNGCLPKMSNQESCCSQPPEQRMLGPHRMSFAHLRLFFSNLGKKRRALFLRLRCPDKPDGH